MAKYLARTSPTCRGYLGIVIAEPDNENVKPIATGLVSRRQLAVYDERSAWRTTKRS
jgi:hypothetical protein